MSDFKLTHSGFENQDQFSVENKGAEFFQMIFDYVQKSMDEHGIQSAWNLLKHPSSASMKSTFDIFIEDLQNQVELSRQGYKEYQSTVVEENRRNQESERQAKLDRQEREREEKREYKKALERKEHYERDQELIQKFETKNS